MNNLSKHVNNILASPYYMGMFLF